MTTTEDKAGPSELTMDVTPGFTPGPYSVSTSDPTAIVADQHGVRIAYADALRPETLQLFAAAPDLYEALKRLVKNDDLLSVEDEELREALHQGRAAIAKSEGNIE